MDVKEVTAGVGTSGRGEEGRKERMMGAYD
jgi:hypothetical protein